MTSIGMATRSVVGGKLAKTLEKSGKAQLDAAEQQKFNEKYGQRFKDIQDKHKAAIKVGESDVANKKLDTPEAKAFLYEQDYAREQIPELKIADQIQIERELTEQQQFEDAMSQKAVQSVSTNESRKQKIRDIKQYRSKVIRGGRR